MTTPNLRRLARLLLLPVLSAVAITAGLTGGPSDAWLIALSCAGAIAIACANVWAIQTPVLRPVRVSDRATRRG